MTRPSSARRMASMFLAAVLLPTLAWAQAASTREPAASFNEPGNRINLPETVYVIDTNGRVRRAFEGLFVQSRTLQVGADQRALAEGQVTGAPIGGVLSRHQMFVVGSRPSTQSATRETHRLTKTPESTTQTASQSGQQSSGKVHPVLLATSLGFAAGAVCGSTRCSDIGNPDVTSGRLVWSHAALGAGAGALIGLAFR